MQYKILIIMGNHSPLSRAKAEIEKAGSEHGKDFVFEIYPADGMSSEIIEKAKSAHAVLFDGELDKSSLRTLSKNMNLHTLIRRAGDCTLVNDSLGGIYFKDKGFKTNKTFGREAYDTECYSELEIERTARIAYELYGNDALTLIDKADELASGKLWRKIVTDINEDYPYVRVNALTADVAAEKLADGNLSGVLLTNKLFGDILYGILKLTPFNRNAERGSQSKGGERFSAIVGDTTLAAYGIFSEADVPCAIKFMLRHSFDI